MNGFQVGEQVYVLDCWNDQVDFDGVVMGDLGNGDYLVRVVVDGVNYDDRYSFFQLADPALYD